MPKLMLVEDDNNLREIYEARLQAEGYTIVSAKDGEEALTVAKAEKPDLIISDVMMPKISGFEMLDILRNTEGLRNAKVIMLTALGQVDDQQRATKLGADRYLVKSQVTLEDIVREAHALLEDNPSNAAPPPPAPVATPPEPSSPPVSPPTTADFDTAAKQSEEASEKEAQSTSKEEARVEEKIEDFVDGATTDATPPSSGETVKEAPVEPAAGNVAADDKIMQDAVNSLMSEGDQAKTDTQPASPGIVNETAEQNVTPKISTAQSAVPPVKTTDVDAAPAAPQNDNVTIAHKKVISPPDSKEKPDINTLYAQEQAQEETAKHEEPVVSSPPSSDTPKIVPDQSDGSSSADPNSIAL